MHLGDATQRVRVLNQMVRRLVRSDDLAPVQHVAEVLGYGQSSRVRSQAHHVDPETSIGAECGFDGHRPDRVRRVAQSLRSVKSKDPQRQHPLGPIDQRETLLVGEVEGIEAGVGKGVGRRLRDSTHLDVSLTHEGQREMRQQRKVSRSSKRPLARHDRMYAGIEQVDESRYQLQADAGDPGSERPGLQQHHRPDDFGREWGTDGRGVGAHQLALELGEARGFDPDACEITDARGDAVHQPSRIGGFLDDRARPSHPFLSGFIEGYGTVLDRNLNDIVEVERPATSDGQESFLNCSARRSAAADRGARRTTRP